jgi:hypothetical protein
MDKIFNFDKKVDYTKVQELSSPQIGDKDSEIWNIYKNMSMKNPAELDTYYDLSKRLLFNKTNIRKLESKLDGDWYYLLRDLFGSYITKVKPGKTEYTSNINDITKSYGELSHIRCGPSQFVNFGVRLSTCIYFGKEIQIPISEVKKFQFADYYFFEKEGLFLLFNVKKFDALDSIKKYLIVGKSVEDTEKRFENYSFNIEFLLKFGCIDHYGFCDGTTIFKDSSIIQSPLKYDSKGQKIKKYKSFSKIWMRGCRSTLKNPKYIAFFISPTKGRYEIMKSQTIAGITQNFTNKKGKKLTRQAFSTQARVNTENYLKGIIPQRLSLAYIRNAPYFLMNVSNIKLTEKGINNYLYALHEDLEFRREQEDLTSFLIKRSIKLNKIITQYTMSVDDYFEYIEYKRKIPLNSLLFSKIEEYKLSDIYQIKKDKNSNYYKSDVGYYANRKRNFISRKDIFRMKIEILSGDNFLSYDFYKVFKKIKGNHLRSEENITITYEDLIPAPTNIYKSLYFNVYESLDKNKSFSNLKTIIRNKLKTIQKSSP